MPICGRYVHDAAVVLWQHHAKFVLHAQQCSEHVRIERRRVALCSLLRYRAGHVFFAAYIGANEIRFRTLFADFSDQVLAFFVTPTRDNKLSAFLGKREGRCPPDACQSSCNQNNLGIH